MEKEAYEDMAQELKFDAAREHAQDMEEEGMRIWIGENQSNMALEFAQERFPDEFQQWMEEAYRESD